MNFTQIEVGYGEAPLYLLVLVFGEDKKVIPKEQPFSSLFGIANQEDPQG